MNPNPEPKHAQYSTVAAACVGVLQNIPRATSNRKDPPRYPPRFCRSSFTESSGMHRERGDWPHSCVFVFIVILIHGCAVRACASVSEPFVELPRVEYVREFGLRVRVGDVVSPRVVQLRKVDPSARPRLPETKHAVILIAHTENKNNNCPCA